MRRGRGEDRTEWGGCEEVRTGYTPGGQHPTVSLGCGQGGARYGTCSLGHCKGGW